MNLGLKEFEVSTSEVRNKIFDKCICTNLYTNVKSIFFIADPRIFLVILMKQTEMKHIYTIYVQHSISTI